jgi:hypothetical protein
MTIPLMDLKNLKLIERKISMELIYKIKVTFKIDLPQY